MIALARGKIRKAAVIQKPTGDAMKHEGTAC